MKHEIKETLSTLWAFVLFNMVFADIVGFLSPGALEEIMAMKPSQGMLLIFSILLEIPITMIIMSRLLKYKANRLANIVAGSITIIFVILGGNTSLSYVFFSTIEVLCLLFIILSTWRWNEQDAND